MRQRADAIRNRAAILDATEALFRHDDPGHVTLARIAEAAGVGKATVLRRFGDLGVRARRFCWSGWFLVLVMQALSRQ